MVVQVRLAVTLLAYLPGHLVCGVPVERNDTSQFRAVKRTMRAWGYLRGCIETSNGKGGFVLSRRSGRVLI